MATMYPPRFPSGSPTSERNVYEALQGLDDDWLVFHSVGWQGARHGKQGDGEADFVIAHPRKGVMVVEVKGGNVEIRDGRWFSIDRSGSPHFSFISVSVAAPTFTTATPPTSFARRS